MSVCLVSYLMILDLLLSSRNVCVVLSVYMRSYLGVALYSVVTRVNIIVPSGFV